MRQIKILGILMILSHISYGIDASQKHSLKCNMIHPYDEDPPVVESISDMFSQGIFYGRFRMNSFGLKWKNELDIGNTKIRKDHALAAIGGSMIYRSAYLYGFGFGAGLYTSQALGTLNKSETYLYKSAKDTLNRYDILTQGKTGLNALAQAYLEYKTSTFSLKAGRQIFESYLTKSNDTKMIPNTFEGLTLNASLTPKTTIKMAYLTRQKLRDRSGFHHLLAVGDDSNDIYSVYKENDDSAMHFGLTVSKLEAKGIEDRLIIVEAKNTSIDYLTLRMNYTAVPELLSSVMLQADYRFYLGDWSIIPGVRYMQQFDHGAGVIGGANLKTLTQGYTNPESLDTALYAGRIDIVEDAFKLRLAVTKVADKGDIVAPWRGFPTAGFTRAMGQYNWMANTKSYMMQVDYEFEEVDELKVISRFAIQDFDDNKIGVQADSKVFTIDLLKGLGESSYYLKTRFAHVSGDANTITAMGLSKLDPSYDEIRIEINYLF